ncbi:hypothetical protein B0A50_03805 [Salinomyces thailandicus]|uniref:Mitochondrial zinc maintenance protein 1, mitochondrial n=1 Tax=Salinomyces thailandicus TaxID=706561 RepID=A0A4U0U0M1_9PEZI|nr:hypothetical protein B0A50_03805 [Salinomyces thailandica]
MSSVEILKTFLASKFLSPAELANNRFVVRATYRHLLRATSIAFKGDTETLQASRALAHQTFQTNAHKLEPNSLEASTAVAHAQGVAQILREHVVQGRKKPGAEDSENYKLNIHEHTQRLENETAGKLRGTTKSFGEIRDASF